MNPLGVKISDKASPDDVLEILNTFNVSAGVAPDASPAHNPTALARFDADALLCARRPHDSVRSPTTFRAA
jgi:hypothetical protein